MKLSEKIFTLRRQLCFSQDDLAANLDVSRHAVYKWENEQSKPELDKLKILSDLFNVSIDNLIDDTADIVFKSYKPVKQLGKVTVLATPSENIGDVKLLDSDEKEIKKVKTVKLITLIGAAVAVISAIICISNFNAMLDTAPFGWLIWLVLSVAILILCGKVFFLYNSVGPEVILNSTNSFTQLKTKTESLLAKKGYDYKLIVNDYPLWFYYDMVSNDKFGFYFDENEQFICPITNYVNFTLDTTNSLKKSITKFNLQYLNENGELMGYEFTLSMKAKHTSSKSGDDLNRIGRITESKNNHKEIKALLDSKKL